MTEATEQLQLSGYQRRVLSIPESIDLLLGGGRGVAKSWTLLLLALRHIGQYGALARILMLRQTYKALADLELISRELFTQVYGSDVRFNAAEHVWRFPGGGYLELGQLESEADYSKYQGRSFTLLLIDEVGQYASSDLLDRMRSNLRGRKDIPVRVVMAANPGGPGHHWLARRYVFRSAPWVPFLEERSKREFAYCPGTFLDNPFIDKEQYRAQLESACPDGSGALARVAGGRLERGARRVLRRLPRGEPQRGRAILRSAVRSAHAKALAHLARP